MPKFHKQIIARSPTGSNVRASRQAATFEQQDPFASDASLPVRVQQVLARSHAGGAKTSCHSAGGLYLRTSSDRNDVVNVASSERTFMLQIKPSDSEASYLLRKVTAGSDMDGDVVPLGAPDRRIAQLTRRCEQLMKPKALLHFTARFH
jgi:hypothetical protein